MPIGEHELLRFAQRAVVEPCATLGAACATAQRFARILFHVFPALAHLAPLERVQSWDTVARIVQLVLGIPASCIDVARLRVEPGEALHAVAALFFFDAVARDHAFQAELAIPMRADACEFLQSPESVAVLLRGGAVPVIDGGGPAAAAAGPATPTHRKLHFAPHSPAEAAAAESQPDSTAAVADAAGGHATQAPAERTNAVLHAADGACARLRAIMASYADMVDAALGSPELSAASSHRRVLAAGLAAVADVESALSAAAGSGDTVSAAEAERLRGMIVRAIRERDRAVAEAAWLRERSAL